MSFNRRNSIKDNGNIGWDLFRLLIILLCIVKCHADAFAIFNSSATAGIRVQGSGIPPQLGFACCDQGIEQMQALFADPGLIPELKALHAEVAIAILDFSPQRAEVARRLNQAGIPVIAWVQLSQKDGFYLNADNEPQAAARITALEQWTQVNGLQWAAIGLDIEPNFNEFAGLKKHPWRLIATLISRSLQRGRSESARHAYSVLVHDIQSRGYPVQTYLMPYVPAERIVHSTLLDRALGTVDVSGNQAYLMLYTNSARPVGAGMIWSLGRNAQAISVGSTAGSGQPGSGNGPLDWDEFHRDLIVASHFSRSIGIYNLEGCVRQGFLQRLQLMDWSQSVTIPSASIRRSEWFGSVFRVVLWTVSHLLYFIIVLLLLLTWFIWRRSAQNVSTRTKKTASPPDFKQLP